MKFRQFLTKNEEKRLVYGIVYEPYSVDTQGDYASDDEIEKACHKFMENWQKVGLMHQRDMPDIKVVECYVAPTNFRLNGEEIKKGSWVLAVKVYNDTIWEMVKKGELTGFSLQGYGREKEKDKE